MNHLKQYYTGELYSTLLVSKLSHCSPNHVIDLSVGEGALVKAAYNRWKESNLICVDIDELAIKKVKFSFPFSNVYHYDGLSNELTSQLNLTEGSVDIAVCNPPFLLIQNKKKYYSLFEEALLTKCKQLPHITSDLVFLAQNLKLLKYGGELGIIIPDTLITRQDFIYFRDALLENHSIETVIQLPDNIFRKTEARTHILVIRKGYPTKKFVEVYKADAHGKCSYGIEINSNYLSHRMDFDFLEWNSRCNYKCEKTVEKKERLGNLIEGIVRGTYSHNVLKKNKIRHFHTTDFGYANKKKMNVNLKYTGRFADPGDILLARVGKRILGRVVIVNYRVPISDCILAIKPKSKYRDLIYNALISPSGQEWLKMKSRGVCARVISKQELFEFPVPIK